MADKSPQTDRYQQAIQRLTIALDEARKSQGLTQKDLAAAAEVDRMTAQRLRAGQGSPLLSNMIAMGDAAGLDLVWQTRESVEPVDQDLITHTGLSFIRTNNDSPIEKALAQHWQAANKISSFMPGVMELLVPDFDQAQATAAATVAQWMGSPVGFNFLREALGSAGYAIVDLNQESAKMPKTGKSSNKSS